MTDSLPSGHHPRTIPRKSEILYQLKLSIKYINHKHGTDDDNVYSGTHICSKNLKTEIKTSDCDKNVMTIKMEVLQY